MAAHAVEQGLPEEFARHAAKGVVVGASQPMANAGVDPTVIVQDMIDYRGTSAAALVTMVTRGFRESVSAGLDAAAKKAAAMSC
ncbi:pyrroline-5-carboxylate reductase dimerization domain-containing protein [Microvirga vignae]|uniref:pyrroline-5-carboxylate reductase dimerization domain-containing protein n=1 Tax=Microvirga vignae TaxID=1225564 RepID=UPI0009FD2484|nr:pyrroline-5-carboxylate reductase dimerization domain-containing protein [Microvirga vignae]